MPESKLKCRLERGARTGLEVTEAVEEETGAVGDRRLGGADTRRGGPAPGAQLGIALGIVGAHDLFHAIVSEGNLKIFKKLKIIF